MTQHATIMWDQDGIHANWTRGFNIYCGRDTDEVWTSWSHYKTWGWDTDRFLKTLDRFGAEGHFRNLEAHEDALEAHRILDGHNLRQIVVTDKPNDQAFIDSQHWLFSHGIFPYTSIRSADKTEFLQFALPDDKLYAIDDRVENVQALLAAGVEAYLRDQPWNRYVTDLPRVDDCLEFARIVLTGIGAE